MAAIGEEKKFQIKEAKTCGLSKKEIEWIKKLTFIGFISNVH